MGKSIHSSGPNTKRKRNAKTIGAGNERKISEGRERSDNLQWQNCEETVIQQTSLECFYTNANSLVQKMDELRDRALEKDYDIIAVVETWAHSGIGDAELTTEGFDMHRADRKGKRGGGVVIYVKETLMSSYTNNNVNIEAFEDCVWCNIQTTDEKILVCVCATEAQIVQR